jgi:hypothetical protein
MAYAFRNRLRSLDKEKLGVCSSSGLQLQEKYFLRIPVLALSF